MDKGGSQTSGLKDNELMFMHKALHPKDDMNRFYVSRNEGRKEHPSIEDCIKDWELYKKMNFYHPTK